VIDRITILEEAKEVFFKAMQDGYAGDCKKSVKTLSNNGNTKTITFTDGDYKVVDEWHTNPDSDLSSGTTTIFHKDRPIWWMSYCGKYPKDVIPFLKQALKKTYERGEFNIGRGAQSYEGPLVGDKRMHYSCTKTINEFCDFQRFNGIERITEITGSLNDPARNGFQLGYHQIMGMSLI